MGRRHLVLIEGPSKRDKRRLTGRTCGNRRVVLSGNMAPAQVNRAPASKRSASCQTVASGVRTSRTFVGVIQVTRRTRTGRGSEKKQD